MTTNKPGDHAGIIKHSHPALPFILSFLLLVLLIFSAFQAWQLRENRSSLDSWKQLALSLEDIADLRDPKPIHLHADFAVYINGERVVFDLPEFDDKNALVHLHLDNPDGDKVIHVEASGITIGHFFNTLGIKLDSKCISFNGATEYCENEGNILKFIVNGQYNNEVGYYVIKDLDKILISFGPKDEDALQQFSKLSNLAEYYSAHLEEG